LNLSGPCCSGGSGTVRKTSTPYPQILPLLWERGGIKRKVNGLLALTLTLSAPKRKVNHSSHSGERFSRTFGQSLGKKGPSQGPSHPKPASEPTPTWAQTSAHTHTRSCITVPGQAGRATSSRLWRRLLQELPPH